MCEKLEEPVRPTNRRSPGGGHVSAGTASSTSGTPMISMREVEKHFGTLHVLKTIQLEVPSGQVVIVIGPSGSGKSTLCRTINRLESIDSGYIAIDGVPLPSSGRGTPSIAMYPESMDSSRLMVRHRVDLPEPD